MKKVLSVLIAVALVACLACTAFAADDNWADYQQYVISYAVAGAPTEADAESMTDLIMGCENMDDIAAVEDIQVFFEVLGALDYDAWVDAGMPAEGDMSGSASGEASDEASGEASGDTSEAAYQEYLKSYVDACPAVTDEQYEEFAALIDAGDYSTFPVEMCFTDTYWGFVAATYDEFVAAGGNVELPDFDPSLTADAEA